MQFPGPVSTMCSGPSPHARGDRSIAGEQAGPFAVLARAGCNDPSQHARGGRSIAVGQAGPFVAPEWAACNDPLRHARGGRSIAVGQAGPFAAPEWAGCNDPSRHAQGDRSIAVGQACSAAVPRLAICNDPSRRVRVNRLPQGPLARPVRFAERRLGKPLPRAGGSACPSCRFSFQRPDADDAHHAGMHVVEQVTVKRPVARRVCGQIEVDIAAR